MEILYYIKNSREVEIVVEKSAVESCFSEELHWIDDKSLRDKVITVWVEAANRGKWKSLDDAPFTLLFENSGKLTDHTKRVTRMVKGILDLRKERINELRAAKKQLIEEIKGIEEDISEMERKLYETMASIKAIQLKLKERYEKERMEKLKSIKEEIKRKAKDKLSKGEPLSWEEIQALYGDTEDR